MNLKEEGQMYEAIREELLDEKFEGGQVKEMERLSSKYCLPNVRFNYVSPSQQWRHMQSNASIPET